MGRYFVRETLKPVDDNLDTMHHFIHDAGHELKTPLAIISGNLQILRDMKNPDPSLVTESIGTILSMKDSLDGLLELTNLKEKKIGKTRLSETLKEEIEKQRKSLEKKHITIHTDVNEGVTLKIDPKHFALLFSNLLKNAITYNKDG